MAVSRRRGVVTAGEPAGATVRERDRGEDPDRKERVVGSTVGTAVDDRAGVTLTAAAPRTARMLRAKHRSGGAAPMKAMNRKEGNDQKKRREERSRSVESWGQGVGEQGKKEVASESCTTRQWAAAEVRERTAVVGEINGKKNRI